MRDLNLKEAMLIIINQRGIVAEQIDIASKDELRATYPVGSIVNLGSANAMIDSISFYPDAYTKKGLVVYRLLAEVQLKDMTERLRGINKYDRNPMQPS